MVVIALVGCTLLWGGALAAQAQESVDGRAVYQTSCAGCHQVDGRGIPGTFPPLADNPRVADIAYVADVIVNGLAGELEVGATIYDGRMPAIDLSDAERAAVIDYIQTGFDGSPQSSAAPGPAGEDGFPWTTVFLFGVIVAMVTGVALIANPAPPAPATRSYTWGTAIVIVLYFVISTVWLPSQLLDDPAMADWPEAVRGLMASAVWMVALGAGMIGLRWAQKSGRL